MVLCTLLDISKVRPGLWLDTETGTPDRIDKPHHGDQISAKKQGNGAKGKCSEPPSKKVRAVNCLQRGEETIHMSGMV